MVTKRSRTAVAAVGNSLYAIGGFDSTNDLASAECYNPQINKVSALLLGALFSIYIFCLVV